MEDCLALRRQVQKINRAWFGLGAPARPILLMSQDCLQLVLPRPGLSSSLSSEALPSFFAHVETFFCFGTGMVPWSSLPSAKLVSQIHLVFYSCGPLSRSRFANVDAQRRILCDRRRWSWDLKLTRHLWCILEVYTESQVRLQGT